MGTQQYSALILFFLFTPRFDKHFDKQCRKSRKKGLGALAEALLSYSVFLNSLKLFSYMPIRRGGSNKRIEQTQQERILVKPVLRRMSNLFGARDHYIVMLINASPQHTKTTNWLETIPNRINDRDPRIVGIGINIKIRE